MAAGFVHGVLNTDNMNITGESFDYGPWRFLPTSDPNFTAAYFDEAGRYAFGRQPQATAWNLAQLASALTVVSEAPPLEAALRRFAPAYQLALRDRTFARLGIAEGVLANDLDFLAEFFRWMTDSGANWPQTFHDWFCGAASEARAMAGPQAALYRSDDFASVRAALTARAPVRADRLRHSVFLQPAPPTLLIEEVETVWDPIAVNDDWSAFHNKLAAIAALREALDLAPQWRRDMPPPVEPTV
jgi:uncharacterized protein YdiU (UPF0061 family)